MVSLQDMGSVFMLGWLSLMKCQFISIARSSPARAGGFDRLWCGKGIEDSGGGGIQLWRGMTSSRPGAARGPHIGAVDRFRGGEEDTIYLTLRPWVV